MVATKNVLSSISTCTGPPIFMEYDILVEVTGQWKVELQHGSFENFLNVPKISVNLIYVDQIMRSGTGKGVDFTLNSVTI